MRLLGPLLLCEDGVHAPAPMCGIPLAPGRTLRRFRRMKRSESSGPSAAGPPSNSRSKHRHSTHRAKPCLNPLLACAAPAYGPPLNLCREAPTECTQGKPGSLVSHCAWISRSNYGTESDPDFTGYHNGNTDPRGFGRMSTPPCTFSAEVNDKRLLCRTARSTCCFLTRTLCHSVHWLGAGVGWIGTMQYCL